MSVTKLGYIARFCLGAGVFLGSISAVAKDYKSSEMITRDTYKYGAVEARIRAAEAPGAITAFFYWKHDSELDGTEWQEQDFEIFGNTGAFQTQLMMPGNPRTEHNIYHRLPTPAWDNYYTYRMEWTPEYAAFYIDGDLMRYETDPILYGKVLDPARAEPAQIRLSLWAGDGSFTGAFDESAVPYATLVEYFSVYTYDQSTGEFVLDWRDDFEFIDESKWWFANWTFSHSVTDYVSQNATTRDGKLVLALTDNANSGEFDVPIYPDNDLIGWGNRPLDPPWYKPTPIPGRIEAEIVSRYNDSDLVNSGGDACGGNLSLDVVFDPALSDSCFVAFTRPGEWTQYKLNVQQAGTYLITFHAGAHGAGNQLSFSIDGDPAGVVELPNTGRTPIEDVTATVELEEGVQNLRVNYVTGSAIFDYADFQLLDDSGEPIELDPIAPTPVPEPAGPAPVELEEEPVVVDPLACSQTIDAASMTATAGGERDEYWNLWSNGSLSVEYPFAGGEASIVIMAVGEPAADEFPYMRLLVDGEEVDGVFVESESTASYSFTVDAPEGEATIEIEFDNDFLSDEEDRNLLIDEITVDSCS